jgi:hypothetical protein
MLELSLVLLFTLVLNLPFGYWREGVKKFSVAWFAAVHAAVPLVVGARLLLGIEFQWINLPLMVAAYFAGQTIGARLRRRAAQGVSP